MKIESTDRHKRIQNEMIRQRIYRCEARRQGRRVCVCKCRAQW